MQNKNDTRNGSHNLLAWTVIGLTIVLILSTIFPLPTAAQSKNTATKTGEIKSLPKDLEIQLALSALPPHLRDSATVYILNPNKGFEVANKGTNGFHTFVARTGDDGMRGSWVFNKYRDDIIYPISFDQAGAKAMMPVFFDIAAMQAKGTSAQEVKKIIQNRYKTKFYKAPEKAGVSYMLSPILRTYTNPDANDTVVTLSIPHIMYYSPDLSDKDIGGGTPGGQYPFIINKGAHGFSIQLLGKEERDSIKKDYANLLSKLCAINKAWCVPEIKEENAATNHDHN